MLGMNGGVTKIMMRTNKIMMIALWH